ncbi:restriction endonuclease subunit S [Mycolicibacterium mucogenicum]|uniref:Restriction endonuclease subunit S n=1 Tax=Mycolicibacterium mucogenicum TaxID=56689 RepID=A0A4V3AWC1_MYCMU|nr:restriction endonuclease subunit S [Mycolicibacterium mucogenicum]TDK89632.1 restriction endonuclease subunit S [Mycolicibacterium mucogenicum]
MSWPTALLGDVVEFLDHMRKPITASDRVEGPYPYYGANGQQGTVDGFIFDEPLLLLAEDGGHFDNPDRGIAYTVSGKTWVNNHAHVLRMSNRLDLRYASHVLVNRDVRKYITGTTRAKLTKSGAASIEIPLPPLDEQRRIAAILDLVDTLLAKCRESVVHHGDLVNSVFQEMFGNLPASRELSAGCLRITDGTHQSPKWTENGVPFLFITNITSGEIDFATKKFISEETWHELTRRSPIEVGDVLYSTVGVTYGIPAVVRTQQQFAFQRHIAHIKPDPAIFHPDFLATLLASPLVKRQADRVARGAAQPTVNLADIKNFEVPIPPYAQQEEFVKRLTAIRLVLKKSAAATDFLIELLASLRSRAFRGEL